MGDLMGSGYQDQRSAPKKWTVMVYMAAQGVEGEAKSLFDEAEADIKEMEKVFENKEETHTLNVLYQLHGKGLPERCHVGHGERKAFDESPADATNGRSLANFVLWALEKARHSGPGDHSLLVLWGHAYRFGIGNAVTPDGIDAIDFEELARVLRETQRDIQKLLGMEKTPKLDVIAFDACDISTVEVAVQVAEFADYMLASQVGIPLPGWPYTRILERLAKKQGDRLMGPAEFGTYAVRRFCETYNAEQRAVSLTMLDLKNTSRLFALTEALARELAIASDDDDEELSNVLELFRRSQTIERKPFVDVADLCLNLLRHSGYDRVRQAAKQLGDFLASPGPVVPGASETGAGRPIVMEHGTNGAEMARLRGLSLYAPHVVDGGYDWVGALHWYEKFVFAKVTLWNDLVRALVQETE